MQSELSKAVIVAGLSNDRRGLQTQEVVSMSDRTLLQAPFNEAYKCDCEEHCSTTPAIVPQPCRSSSSASRQVYM